MSVCLLNGDCADMLRLLPDNSVDAVVSDPPYGLSKEPDMIEVLRHWCAPELRKAASAALANGTVGWLRRYLDETEDDGGIADLAEALFPDSEYDHNGRGFMGKTWDSFVPSPAVWREVLRVLKPGGHALVFSGTRTYDLTVLAMRIAGFEIRDQLAWMYGTGFPKSRAIDKDIDRNAGAVRPKTKTVGTDKMGQWRHRAGGGAHHHAALMDEGVMTTQVSNDDPITPDAIQWQGWGTALKPAQEPIVLARKPLIGTVAANVLEHGTGGINVDGCRIGDEIRHNPPVVKGWQPDGTYSGRDAVGKTVEGRWPANVLLDETAAAILDEQSGTSKSGTEKGPRGRRPGGFGDVGHEKGDKRPNGPQYGDSGGASRFFYCAKASKTEREAGLEDFRKASAGELTGGRAEGSDGLKNPRAGAGRTSKGRANTHPTVKPIALMRWLVRLITPPGGLVLDPYAGSGSTGCAAVQEGLRFVGIELEPEYAEIAQARIDHWAKVPA